MAYYHQEVYKNEHSVLHLIGKIRDQHSSGNALLSDSNLQQHQVRQNGSRKQISFAAFKNLFFVNIKTISTKEVNLSTKLHMNILKGLSKNEKLLKKLLWNSTETLFRNQVWNIHKIKSLIYCLFLNINTKISTLQQKYNIRGASPLVLVIPNYFCDNLKPAKLQISKPLTSNLNECAVCKPVFSITTCNLICQLNFNI